MNRGNAFQNEIQDNPPRQQLHIYKKVPSKCQHLVYVILLIKFYVGSQISIYPISTYIQKGLSVCVYTFFSAISKPIGITFGTMLLFAHGKVLKQ